MEKEELKIKCLEAAKTCSTVADFAECIGYRRGGLHKRTFERLNKICGIDLKKQIELNAKEKRSQQSNLKQAKRNCLFCGREFSEKYSKYSNGNFCSKECSCKYSSRYANTDKMKEIKRKAARSYYQKHPEHLDSIRDMKKVQEGYKRYIAEKEKQKVEWTCPVCSKHLLLSKYQAGVRKFCSRRCRNLATNKFKNGSKSKAELELKKVLYDKFPEILISYNDRVILNGLELDVYIPSLNYAVEWNGIFHYVNINGKLEKVQERDKLKQVLCRERGITLRVIKDLKSDKKNINNGINIILEDIARLVQQ